jgi:NhaP-type Na+/H+ or K+/H+ antiporter
VPVAIEPGLHVADPLAIGFLFLGIVLAVALGAISQTEERAFSPAIVYLALGAVAAVFIHLLGVRWTDPLQGPQLLEHLSEFTLIVALFGAGLRFGARPPRPLQRATIALVAVSLPIAVALVALFGFYAMGLSLGGAILLGGILVPTDPVLAGDIGVPPPGRPEDETRPAQVILSAEAGLNDGLATPFVLLGLLVAGRGGHDWIGSWVGIDLAYEVGVGLAIGAAAGYALGALVMRLRESEFVAAELETFPALAAAFLVYGLAEVAGTLGLVAAFAGGVAFRRYEEDHESHQHIHRGAARVQNLLEVGVMLVLGSVLTIGRLGVPGLAGWLLAPLLLLAIRPATVLVGLVGVDCVGWRGRVFLGWFGVRGVATIYYAAAVVASGVLSTAETRTVFWTSIAVVIVSVVVHGVTASPLEWLAQE